MQARILFLLVLLICANSTFAQKKSKDDKSENKSNISYSGLKFRSIGPALTSGRIADFAVNPNDHSEYYVAVASGGVWKTVNAGTTYTPVFDSYGSYSIGTVVIDPNNTNVVWIGTGENNNQRSVAYGDGVYKSDDGGKSWHHMGLKNSEHISKIIIDPANSDHVYVAAYGPLWSEGGDRGIYESFDGGKTWNKILNVSEHTGFADLVMDPSDPKTLYAAAHQRRRHVFTYISGGPESAIYKSSDGGKNWNKLTSGLPKADLGRIGLAVSPVDPNVVYAIIEATEGKDAGFYRSTNKGASWQRMSGHNTSGNYYQEIFADPKDVDKVYSMDTWGQVSTDGGKTWQRIGNQDRHVDDHALWIDPTNTRHLLNGNDGGVYETWDGGKTWNFKANMPITQFYKVTTDNASPFYNVYGGTQDNFTLGGPSRTTNAAGITNSDWFVTNGGDGFESAVDPEDPNIVYSQSQYGWLVRYDKRSGEATGIKPIEGKGEEALRWNWDSPLIISPHNNKRIYFAANKLYMSDDRGDSWQLISGDLTRQIDRNKLPVMGKVWSVDAVAKNASTSNYGNIVTLSESPLQEGLLYAGTDDGLIQVTEDNGKNWRKIDKFSGVPEVVYVNSIVASQHDKNTVYAAFNNHKNGDFKPYILKSTDKGKSWTSVTGNLPERGSVYAIAEDHKMKDLLFAGTEFGLFFSIDGGKNWNQIKNGLPTVAVRDIDIQKREDDLVLATFGRGFYVLDDYNPLRYFTEDAFNKEAQIFPIKDALVFIESKPFGLPGNSFQGASFYAAPNPPVGAVFTYFLKNDIKTKKQLRQEKEKQLSKENKTIEYPSFEDMRAEDAEEDPYLVFTVSDEKGNVVRRIKAPATSGLQRVVWDFRYPANAPVSLSSNSEYNPFADQPVGPLAAAGKYFVSLSKSENGKWTELVPNQSFNIKSLGLNAAAPTDQQAALQFQMRLNELNGTIAGAIRAKNEMESKIKYLKAGVFESPTLKADMMNELKNLETQLEKVELKLTGDQSLSKRNFDTPPSIAGRVGTIAYYSFNSTFAPSKAQKENFKIAQEEFMEVLNELRSVDKALAELDKKYNKAGAPWTPGRVPDWMAD